MNELHKHVAVRLDQVSNRLKALRQEEQQLTAEHAHLTELHKLYKEQAYDPIEEERRVTEGILQASATKELLPITRRGNNLKGACIYDEPFQVIFTTLKNPIPIRTIQKELRNIIDGALTDKNIDMQLRKQINKGNIARVGHGLYSWTGDKRNATATIPD